MDQKTLKKRRHEGGFTLTEIMVVVFIIGLLSTAVLINVVGATGQSRVTKAKADIVNLSNALDQYNLDIFDYPSQQQGLEALVEAPSELPNGASYRTNGYIRKLPNDPWGRPYIYERPGSKSGGSYDLYSLGADGEEGGEDQDADIGNWT